MELKQVTRDFYLDLSHIVSCHVERLQLSFNRLEGPIPTDFGLMRNLELFSLGHNELIGTLPTELGSLSRLGE